MDSALLVLIVLLVLLVISVVVFIVLVRNSQQKSPEEPAARARAARESLATDVSEAVAALRDRVPGGRFRERVPWVLLMGEPEAGKTALLDQMASATTGIPMPADGVQWRFLEGGAVIDVPGSFLVDADGKNQIDGRWQRLLRLLLKHRPSRPLDGLVLAIPAAELLKQGEVAAAHLTAAAAALRDKLDVLQRQLGLVIPIYVLITKCDQVRGFGSFCWEINPDMDDDVFGWSNPNTLESAFASEWVDHAFDFMRDGILQQQMRIFGSRAPSAAGDELFLFPMEFDRMRNPLRGYLSQMFRETSYLDSNFLRGIYFCGDASVVLDRIATRGASIGAAVSLIPAGVNLWDSTLYSSGPGLGGSEMGGLEMVASRGHTTPHVGRRLVFIRHLFDFKVFLESKVARPVSQIRFSRNRTVLCAQIALAIFIVVFGAGSSIAWLRLKDLRDHKFYSLLDALQGTLPGKGKVADKVPTVQTAYDLVDTLGTVDATGYKSFFFPASWNDPIGGRVTEALTRGFGYTVLPALREGLDFRVDGLLGKCQAETPQLYKNSEKSGDAFAAISFTKDPQYIALQQFLTRFNDLNTSIRRYEDLRHQGNGRFTDLDLLFQYLLGRNLVDLQNITNSYYFQHALSEAKENPIAKAGDLNKCAADMAGSLIGNFYSSWLENNPLFMSSGDIAQQIERLNNGQVSDTDDLSSLVLDIRNLDTEVTSSSMGWLTGPDFDQNVYPALSQLKGAPFATEDLITAMTMKGSASLAELKGKLFSSDRAGGGTVLEMQGTELHVSGAVIALELALTSLLNQDFMQIQQAGTSSSTNVIWNKTTLGRAAQLKDSYDKFVKDRLSTLPPVLRASVQRLALQSLTNAIKATVTRAAEPQSQDDETTTLLEIKSFKDAVPILTQLQDSLSGKILPSAGTFNSTLSAQSVALAQRLNNDLDATYPYSLTSLDTWNGNRPFSWTVLDVDSADGIEQYLATQRDRIKSLAVDYAQPLASYLQPQGLQQVANFGRWTSIIRDLQDYDAKKPGNPMAALETFVRSDLDKIAPATACRSTGTAAQSNDFFLRIRADIQRAAVNECAGAGLRAYTSGLADFFNAKLAGKFPFGPLPAAPGVPQADPRDAARFFSVLAARGPALRNYLSQRPAYADILAFINQAEDVSQMFAGGLNDATPFADAAVYFRVNQAAEMGGNEVIDWDFESGDQKAHYPGAAGGVRWHYGDAVRVTMRYAKDSPNVPQPGGAGPDARVDGRTVTWTRSGGWSLFALLAAHAGTASEYGTTPDALASTLRFVIPTLPDSTRARASSTPSQPGETRVYIRLGLRIPGAKEAREVPIAAFPLMAPVPTQGTQ
jgi:type VI secretion system protein ImpL